MLVTRLKSDRSSIGSRSDLRDDGDQEGDGDEQVVITSLSSPSSGRYLECLARTYGLRYVDNRPAGSIGSTSL